MKEIEIVIIEDDEDILEFFEYIYIKATYCATAIFINLHKVETSFTKQERYYRLHDCRSHSCHLFAPAVALHYLADLSHATLTTPNTASVYTGLPKLYLTASAHNAQTTCIYADTLITRILRTPDDRFFQRSACAQVHGHY